MSEQITTLAKEKNEVLYYTSKESADFMVEAGLFRNEEETRYPHLEGIVKRSSVIESDLETESKESKIRQIAGLQVLDSRGEVACSYAIRGIFR